MSNKKNHTAKILQKTAKRASTPSAKTGKPRPEVALREQYNIIRQDLLKLREDIVKGYDMAKNLFDRNSMKSLLRSK